MPDRLPDHYDPNAVEQTVKDHWTDAEAFPGVDAPEETSHAYEYTKDRSRERDGEELYFLDGPPFTSGRMHVGNAWGRSSRTRSCATIGCRGERSERDRATTRTASPWR